jgi:hypothetical protein
MLANHRSGAIILLEQIFEVGSLYLANMSLQGLPLCTLSNISHRKDRLSGQKFWVRDVVIEIQIDLLNYSRDLQAAICY